MRLVKKEFWILLGTILSAEGFSADQVDPDLFRYAVQNSLSQFELSLSALADLGNLAELTPAAIKSMPIAQLRHLANSASYEGDIESFRQTLEEDLKKTKRSQYGGAQWNVEEMTEPFKTYLSALGAERSAREGVLSLCCVEIPLALMICARTRYDVNMHSLQTGGREGFPSHVFPSQVVLESFFSKKYKIEFEHFFEVLRTIAPFDPQRFHATLLPYLHNPRLPEHLFALDLCAYVLGREEVDPNPDLWEIEWLSENAERRRRVIEQNTEALKVLQKCKGPARLLVVDANGKRTEQSKADAEKDLAAEKVRLKSIEGRLATIDVFTRKTLEKLKLLSLQPQDFDVWMERGASNLAKEKRREADRERTREQKRREEEKRARTLAKLKEKREQERVAATEKESVGESVGEIAERPSKTEGGMILDLRQEPPPVGAKREEYSGRIVVAKPQAKFLEAVAEDAIPAAAAEPEKIPLDAHTLALMQQLFRTSAEEGEERVLPELLTFDEVRQLFAALGFGIEGAGGSRYRFQRRIYGERSCTFVLHAPHRVTRPFGPRTLARLCTILTERLGLSPMSFQKLS